ncbi:Uncharacterised protein [Mycobacteroides abscessus subsp. abscessus]|nr:Uncharacterised protein [Mycobacteroides abscessus subsp. abscessus]
MISAKFFSSFEKDWRTTVKECLMSLNGKLTSRPEISPPRTISIEAGSTKDRKPLKPPFVIIPKTSIAKPINKPIGVRVSSFLIIPLPG